MPMLPSCPSVLDTVLVFHPDHTLWYWHISIDLVNRFHHTMIALFYKAFLHWPILNKTRLLLLNVVGKMPHP